jgi:3-oxoacyl-[acyl-carrier-protein] synthase II
MSKYNFPRVVVTGMGAVTPIGNTIEDYWTGLTEGKNGCDLLTHFDTTHFATKFGCEVKNYDPLLHMNRKEIQRMDRFTQLAMSAAVMAVEDSGVNLEQIDRDRCGVIVGSGIGGMDTYEKQHRGLIERDGDPSRISPFFIPMLILDIVPGHIAIRFGFKGVNYATVSACSTSSHSIANAFIHLQRGDADLMITGGTEAVLTPMGVGGFNALKALSTRNDEYKTASRPFDKDRDGFVMGEGAGILVLETLEHAQARGAKIYAEIVGVGMTDDAFHITQPAEGGEGAVRSMKLAIEDAGLNVTDIDYINAHGTSTPFNDKNESAAIKTLFGDHAYKLNVSSTKSMTGHLTGAAGAVEAIATVMTIKHGIVPPTINYQTPDPECDLNYTPNVAVKKEVKAAISNTFGFGGHNATLCFKAFED